MPVDQLLGSIDISTKEDVGADTQPLSILPHLLTASSAACVLCSTHAPSVPALSLAEA